MLAGRILGIGVDMCHTPRFVSLLQRLRGGKRGDRTDALLAKMLHPAEIDAFHALGGHDNDGVDIVGNGGGVSGGVGGGHVGSSGGGGGVDFRRAQFLASRWAVKEALVKATGVRLLFPDIHYARTKKPTLTTTPTTSTSTTTTAATTTTASSTPTTISTESLDIVAELMASATNADTDADADTNADNDADADTDNDTGAVGDESAYDPRPFIQLTGDSVDLLASRRCIALLPTTATMASTSSSSSSFASSTSSGISNAAVSVSLSHDHEYTTAFIVLQAL
jgi:phosphopantetheinyl transferase (holo-ACP synthase)